MGGNDLFDLSTEFNEFYKNCVVLPASVQSDLRKKKKLNIDRLKEGLKEYNKEHNTDYKISESRVQGSMAMHTVVQNDENDYDIDVAIVFESDNLGNLGPLATRNIVAEALSYKMGQFSEPPEVKTSCVRIKYAEGYHVDFAVYRRYKTYDWQDEYEYEHAGKTWAQRSLSALDDWFKEEIEEYGDVLRKVIRLSKMFCKSRSEWRMPSGIIQTVLCDEKIDIVDGRLDETFYNTMKAVMNRIEYNSSVPAPTDNGRELAGRKSDEDRIANLFNRLERNLKKLDVLFDAGCTEQEAVDAWYHFFENDFWSDILNESKDMTKSYVAERMAYEAGEIRNTEEFIEDKYDVQELYDVRIKCEVDQNGFRRIPLWKFYNRYTEVFKGYLPHHYDIYCEVETDAKRYDKVMWKVRNVGHYAIERDCIRGQIMHTGNTLHEKSCFNGPHYIECYLIKDNTCVGIGYIDVKIGGGDGKEYY